MPRICHFDNLQQAFLRAVRGKALRPEVIEWRRDVDERLLQMGRELMDGTFEFGRYRFFTIRDPKPRVICAASFDERVAFHAMMRICHPVFDGYQVDGSHASRVGRGVDGALAQLRRHARRYRWFAKLDMRKYFDSISHEVLLGQLVRLFKDKVLLGHFRRLVATYGASAGCGLPIGNLTSQYFANHYLAVADHYAKEQMRVPALLRYMDDVLLFDDDKTRMLDLVMRYVGYVGRELRLDVHEPVVNATRCGVPYIGYVVDGREVRLNGRSRRRYRSKMRRLNEAYTVGEIDDLEASTRAVCLGAFVDRATNGLSFKRAVARQSSQAATPKRGPT